MFVNEFVDEYARYRALGEKAIAQVPDDALNRVLAPDGNSIAVLMRHIGGNLASRFTNFLTEDGEKPWRDRDSEFVLDSSTNPEQVLLWWNQGWNLVFAAIEPLTAADLERKVTIRGQEHTVLEAISRQMTHYAEHIGQIILLAKHFRGAEWKSLSIPKGQSAKLGVAAERTNRARRG